tara:strand:+ start:20181 stop:20348 length:168 start_codon:yes stop_codon:yes gene_type:complete
MNKNSDTKVNSPNYFRVSRQRDLESIKLYQKFSMAKNRYLPLLEKERIRKSKKKI